MALLTTVSPNASLRGRLRLAHALRMPEADAAAEVRELEASRAFKLLRDTRVVSVAPYTRMRFARRGFEGRELRAASEGLPDVLDGRGDLVRLMEAIGQERFEECFLRADALTDEERARACGITLVQAARLRELVDRLYVQSEFEAQAPSAPSEKTLSAVAGVEIDGGRPVLAFFHQDIWRGRYSVDAGRKAEVLAGLSPSDAREAEHVLFRLGLLERRKSALYQALEMLLAVQADYFLSRDPARRVPLTQRAVAIRIGVAASSFNELVANKAIQLPWGIETPIKTLMPSSKAVSLERLYDLAKANPGLSDQALRQEMSLRFGTSLSRRSVAQYRSELGLAAGRERAVAA